jgi:glycosyltransferase involved in cell wall biosynthesis
VRIAFDHQVFAQQRVGGVSRYYAALARELASLGHHARIVAPIHENQYLDALPAGTVRGWNRDRLPIDVRILNRGINLLVGRGLIRAFRPDVVHETYYSVTGSAPRRTPTVLTVFDMIHELHPAGFGHPAAMSMAKRVAVRRADHVICISEQTRKDLIALFACPSEKVSVVYLAADAFGSSRGSLALPSARPFLLFVGKRGAYKNFDGLLSAMVESVSLRKDFDVVAFGGGALTAAESAAIHDAGMTGRVFQLDGDDAVLGELYRRAAALVYPSKYEGFGLPPLEAMMCGCPVISSNASSLPEVVGDAAELFDPADPTAIARAVESVVYSAPRRAALIQRGTERAHQFSWRRCANETLAVYESLAA